MTYYDNNAVAQAIADNSDYITRRYGPGTNRNWWAIAHRARLLSSGEYIKTTERDQELMDMAMEVTRKVHAKWVGEAGPELINFRP